MKKQGKIIKLFVTRINCFDHSYCAKYIHLTGAKNNVYK